MYETLTKEEFVEAVERNIKNYLPSDYADAEVDIRQTETSSRSYTGLTVRKPSDTMSPTINLDDIFNMGTDFENQIETIASMIMSEIPDDVKEIEEILSNYENAKNYLIIKVGYYEDRKDYFETVAHRFIEDMVITYHILIGETGLITVTNDMLKNFGITESKLFNDAIENSSKLAPAKVMPLTEALGFPNTDGPDVTLVSNQTGFFGASAMLYPNVLNNIAQDKKIYILPSSVHEVLIYPDDGNTDIEQLHQTVLAANNSVVEDEDLLSNHVYSYKNGRFETVA